MAQYDPSLDPRRKRIVDVMQAAIQPKPQEVLEVPVTGAQPNIPVAPPPEIQALINRPPANRSPADMAAMSETPGAGDPRITVGTKGLNNLDRLAAQLEARKTADRTYNSDVDVSNPDFTAINPPLPKGAGRGLGSSLKRLGRDFLVQGGQYAKTHPGASVAELLTAGGVGGGISAASPDLGNKIFRQAQIGKAEEDYQHELGLEGQRAQVDALKTKPWYQAAQLGLGGRRADNADARLDETEKHRVASQYNALPEFDPSDPSAATLIKEMDRLGIPHPKKTRGSLHKLVYDAKTGQYSDIDLGTGQGSTVTQEGGKAPLTVTSEQGLNRDARKAEGKLNREASMARTQAVIKAVGARQEKQIAASIAALGDPDEIAATSAEIKSQAQQKREAAKSAPYAEKQALLREAGALDQAAIRVDQQGLKAKGARGGSKPAPTAKPKYAGRVISRANLKRYADDHGISEDEAKKVFEGAQIVP